MADVSWQTDGRLDSLITLCDGLARDKCFACDKPLGKSPALVDTRDAQTVYVGSECFKKIRAAGDSGYQPPLGGPRLYLLRDK